MRPGATSPRLYFWRQESPALIEVNARRVPASQASSMRTWKIIPLALLATAAYAEPREAELVRLVRQDCGACHGMQLTGGLGLPLTPQALNDKPADSLVATVLYGRPGTAMPPWKSILSERDAEWIVAQLLAGFPQEGR